MTSLATPAVERASDRPFALRLMIVIALAAIADALFYDQRIGLSLVLFLIVLTAASLIANFAQLDHKRARAASAIFVVGALPAIEDLNLLSFLFLLLGTISSITLWTNPAASGLRTPLTAFRQLLLIGPFRLGPDVLAAMRGPGLAGAILGWCVPLAFGLVFLALFAAANPLIERWLGTLRPDRVIADFDRLRALFWLAMLSLIWPFIQLRWRRKVVRPVDLAGPAEIPAQGPASTASTDLLGAVTVLRSLILFNLLFAVQSALDLVYLWGGVALPDGLTYASYAHRGAYALIVTALLAAAFVLIAIRPADEKRPPRLLRPLLYLWVGQNLLLVVSSMLRLKLYIDIYLLTYWRVAALVWMGLVAIGLILIVLRIRLNRSHRWLVRMNLLALAATLYVCALTNLNAIIAGYNVAHSQEAGGKGVVLDICYLASLGPQALPAIDRAIAFHLSDAHLSLRRAGLLEVQAGDMASWRTWSFRSWRLQQYLNTHPPLSPPS
ncbi:DUF4173 domain-containing protein [Bradyrhizobium sp. HKCCYLS1011]|uniref:DUF4153 domain-containing protein n=1 Tax=Bradyrhizobium sp. HKCCYLS1011 TaxID=3420733 RepID=UPI003EB7F240